MLGCSCEERPLTRWNFRLKISARPNNEGAGSGPRLSHSERVRNRTDFHDPQQLDCLSANAARDHVMGEEEVHKLIHDHGFTIANLSSRLSESGQQFEYRMTIKSRDRKKAEALSTYLRTRPEVIEFRITPTGD